MRFPTANAIVVTREELYEQVWAEPMWTLAQRYGLSDVGLAKTCRKHKIPVPGRGYWQQKQAGQRVKPTPLPKLSVSMETALSTLYLRGPQPPRTAEGGSSEIGKDTNPEIPAIIVLDILTDPHPLIAHSVKALRRVKPTKEGLLPQTANANYLDVRVSLDTVDRAMRILDALLKVLDAQGITISIDIQEQRAVTSAYVHDESVPFHVEEHIDHVTEAPPVSKTASIWAARPVPKPVPTGRLEFHIDLGWMHGVENIRRGWRDGKQQRLEDCLGKIVLGLFSAAKVIKADRREREEQERQRQIEDRRRRYGLWEARQEKRRREALQEDLDRWRLCRDLREYVDMRQAHGAPAGADTERWTTWLEWITSYASRVEDRLVSSIGPDPEPFDEKAYYY